MKLITLVVIAIVGGLLILLMSCSSEAIRQHEVSPPPRPTYSHDSRRLEMCKAAGKECEQEYDGK